MKALTLVTLWVIEINSLKNAMQTGDGHFRAQHTLQCNAALLMQPCTTHYRVAAMLCCGFTSSPRQLLGMFHQLNASLQFCHTLKEESTVEQDRGCASSRPASVFFRKLLTFEGIPVSAGATSPWSRPKRSSVPLSDKYRFQWTCVFCLALAFERIGGISKCFD